VSISVCHTGNVGVSEIGFIVKSPPAICLALYIDRAARVRVMAEDEQAVSAISPHEAIPNLPVIDIPIRCAMKGIDVDPIVLETTDITVFNRCHPV
jgi:hypothetical protein